MPIARGEKDYLGFVQGLNTEANPLAAPEGTTSDELNMELNLENGTRARRLGLARIHPADLKFTPSGVTAPDFQVQGVFFWEAIKKYITVFRYTDEEDKKVSSIVVHNQSYDIEFEFVVDTPDDVPPNFVDIRSRLVITLGTSPVILQPVGDTYDVYVLTLYIRDFTLLNDSLSIGERPSTLSDEHKYNLYNAGWYKDRMLGSGSKGDPVTYFNTEIGSYPSNADVVALGDSVDSGSGKEEFDPEALDNIDLGSTESARGHYVYNIRNIDRNSKLTSKNNDGAVGNSATKIIEQGTSTGDGGGTGGSDWNDPVLPPGFIIP